MICTSVCVCVCVYECVCVCVCVCLCSGIHYVTGTKFPHKDGNTQNSCGDIFWSSRGNKLINHTE